MNVGCRGEQMGNINDSGHEWRAKGRLALKHLKGEKLREALDSGCVSEIMMLTFQRSLFTRESSLTLLQLAHCTGEETKTEMRLPRCLPTANTPKPKHRRHHSIV